MLPQHRLPRLESLAAQHQRAVCRRWNDDERVATPVEAGGAKDEAAERGSARRLRLGILVPSDGALGEHEVSAALR